jgi:uncharacterized protein YcbX
VPDRAATSGSFEIVALYRYPLKGFSPEPLTRVAVAAGATFPLDRAFAVENGPSGFDPASPAYLPKARFLMLMRNERIAAYRTRFNEADGMLRIFQDGVMLAEGSLHTATGRTMIEAWLAATFADELRGPPRILAADGHSFSDRAAKVLHVVNLATVHALEAHLGRSIDPLRFRPNVMIDGLDAWSERQWTGASMRLGDAGCAVESRTTRCAATNVDPASGRRDLDIPRALEALTGSADLGIYVMVTEGGTLAIGDRGRVELPS